jgi:hypothetical protein
VLGQGGDQGELEISLGSFDEPALFKPEYEVWIARREAWMPALGLPQFEQDRLTD